MCCVWQDEKLARFVVGSHMRHHPSAVPTLGGESPGHTHLTNKAGVEPIDQDLLRKYIIYSKEKVLLTNQIAGTLHPNVVMEPSSLAVFSFPITYVYTCM